MSKERQLDPATLDLVNQLCTRFGMIMEDSAPTALQLSSSSQETAAKLRNLDNHASSISALVAAAK
jgi:hypothetical protein